MKRKVRIDFSDFWHADTLEAKHSNPIYTLLSKRFDLEFCEQPDFLVYSCFGQNYLRHKGVRIFYTGENRRPNYSLCDWAFGFDYSDDPRYLRWPLYFFYNLAPLTMQRDVNTLMRQKTKFCAFVYSNEKAKERIKLLDKLSRYKPVDCGGKVRNNLGYRVQDKVGFLQDYKFSIAFENSSHPGYTTEKLPEAFAGNTVPIYWGNPLVDRDFNTASFVNSYDFRNLNQLVEFVIELDRNDSLYQRYLGAPAFVDNRPNLFLNEERILNRFETIFATRTIKPSAQTFRGKVANLLQTPKYYRHQRRLRRASHAE